MLYDFQQGMAALSTEFSLLLLLSILLSALAFPLVYLLSLLYRCLCRRYPYVPSLFFLYLMLLLGAFIFLAAAEAYAGTTLAKIASTPPAS